MIQPKRELLVWGFGKHQIIFSFLFFCFGFTLDGLFQNKQIILFYDQ